MQRSKAASKHTRKGKTPARARYGRSPSSSPLTELEESDNELVDLTRKRKRNAFYTGRWTPMEENELGRIAGLLGADWPGVQAEMVKEGYKQRSTSALKTRYRLWKAQDDLRKKFAVTSCKGEEVEEELWTSIDPVLEGLCHARAEPAATIGLRHEIDWPAVFEMFPTKAAIVIKSRFRRTERLHKKRIKKQKAAEETANRARMALATRTSGLHGGGPVAPRSDAPSIISGTTRSEYNPGPRVDPGWIGGASGWAPPFAGGSGLTQEERAALSAGHRIKSDPFVAYRY